MKNKKYVSLLFAMACLLSPFLSGCDKNDDITSSSRFIEGLLYYYTNETTKQIRVIDISVSSPFRRSLTLTDDVTLEVIAQDREDLVLKVYKPSRYSALESVKGKMIKSKVVENNWLYVGNNPFIGLTGTTDDDYYEVSEFSNNATGFIFHKMEEINGEEVYAIESVAYPGRYFSHEGHPIQGANLLYLETYPEPKDAPRFRLYKTKAKYMEGNPHIPVEATIGM